MKTYKTTTMAIKERTKQLHAVLIRAGLMETRQQIYREFGCQTSDELTNAQVNLILLRLTQTRKQYTSSILCRLNLLGIGLVNPSTGATDWDSVNKFLSDPKVSPGKVITRTGEIRTKTLYDMTFSEMEVVFKKVCAIHDYYLKKKQAERHQAALN